MGALRVGCSRPGGLCHGWADELVATAACVALGAHGRTEAVERAPSPGISDVMLTRARRGPDETRSVSRRWFHARTHVAFRAEEFDGVPLENRIRLVTCRFRGVRRHGRIC